MKTQTVLYIAAAVVGTMLLTRTASARSRADADAYGLPNQQGYRTTAAPMSYLDQTVLQNFMAQQQAARAQQPQAQQIQQAYNSGGGGNNLAAVASIASTIASFFD